MGNSFDLIRATPNTIEAIRKAHAIRKDLRPDGSFQYSFPASKPAGYTGQWAVSMTAGDQFVIPASETGNLILTEDRVFATVTTELQSVSSVYSSGLSWCYLHISLTSSSGITLEVLNAPIPSSGSYTQYLDDYIPLALYSKDTGLIQLQYGPVRINRYWLFNGGTV